MTEKKRVREPIPLYRWSAIAAAVAASAGGGVVSAALLGESSPASAHIPGGAGWGHIGEYTYGSGCTDDGVDPITVVFTGIPVTTGFIRDHAAMPSHGWMDNHVGSGQYFLDHGVCQPFDDQGADGGPISDRYHMRWNVADIGGSSEYQAPYGFLAPASPHQEEFIPALENWGCFGSLGGNHAVWANDEVPGGGFTHARDRILSLWLDAGDGHYLVELQDWANITPQVQCDGGVAWSNGIVAIIHTPWVGVGGNLPGRGGFW